MSVDLDKCATVICDAANIAGTMIKNAIYSRDKHVEKKSCDIDLVTETDQNVEKFLTEQILKHFPGHKVIGEESVAGGANGDLTADPSWVIDPIDGTMNFVHGFPFVCISVALLVNKVPEIALIYAPVLDQKFFARKGQGATLNEKPIRVSNITELSDALLAYEFGTCREEERVKIVKNNANKLLSKVHGLRSVGSAALNMALVAFGVADAYLEFGIHAWDIAAGWLIVKEAGGIVIDPAGGELDLYARRVLCAATQELADKMIAEIEQYYPTRD